MDKKSIILLILFITSGIFYYNLTKAKMPTLETNIVRIIDGDTVEISSGDKVRLKGINTPEKGNLGSEESIIYLENLLNESVEIISFGEDKYGRILGYVIYENKNINSEILKRGLASLYYYNEDKFYKEMKNSEEFARMNELGIWKKSSNFGCLEILEFKFKEPEILKIKNSCDIDLEIIIKDDATHIYKELILKRSIFEKETSHIWNDAGDTIYAWDDKGLLIFYRY